MCGIVGFLGGARLSSETAGALIHRMVHTIHHRGPDYTDCWLGLEKRVAFGHKRLAIVELSPAGNQPMRSASGRYIIVYNGEIYNHAEIRSQIEASGHSVEWRGHSDTETLLAAIELWGLKAALQRSTGMFALALWDERDQRLSIARDRVGEKPLYYGWQGDGTHKTFLFGSELKALAQHPSFKAEISREALSLYMRHGYVPTPYTIYRGVNKLVPGTILSICDMEREPSIETYWSGRAAAEKGVAAPIALGPDGAVDELEAVLVKAVGQQMLADVPLGAFLSGGVDSSTVVALMQKQSSRPVKTFSIGFHEEGYDEARYARSVAEHLGTDHTELYVTAGEAMRVIPELPFMYDEPFADSSQIPTFLVSQLARQHVTVALSGDAGDELFAGYERYRMTSKFWHRLSAVPRPLRRMAARGLISVTPKSWNAIAAALGPVLPSSARVTLPGDKIHKGAGVLASNNVSELYHGLASSWRDPASVVIGGSEPPTVLTRDMPELESLSSIERMMAVDLLTYLPDDILVKVDRAAMRVSLETRVPLLDHRVVEFAWRLPMEYKIRGGETKWALRQVLYRHVPKQLIERPKMGFGIPLGEWLRGPLREWTEDLLSERRLVQEGFFHPRPIRRMWEAHLGGQVNEQYRLWVVLMFQSWLAAQAANTRVESKQAVA
jgi:asparagine synthase (glutamine-hydrolysing)